MRTASAILAVLLSGLLLTSCSSSEKNWRPATEQVYLPKYSQQVPQPVYSRLRWVRPPQPLPPQTVNFSGSTKLDPILHLEMQNARLEEIANSLADSVHYRSYVASGIADRLVSIKLLGTVDELALEIERRQQIKVVVDHENREIRFLADKVLPSFYQKEVIENEHKSNY